MPSVDEILAGSPLSGLRRVSSGGGGAVVTTVCLAEQFAELDDAPSGSLVVLGRLASAEVNGYRLDMALRWAAIHGVAAVAAFSAQCWQPALTALDITAPAGIALISIPADAEIATLILAISAEISGGPGRALAHARQGLAAVLRAEDARAEPDEISTAVSQALGTAVEFRPVTPDGDADGHPDGDRDRDPDGDPGGAGGGTPDSAVGREAGGTPGGAAGGGPAGGGPGADGRIAATGAELSVPVLAGGKPSGHFVAADATGDMGVAASLVLHAAAASVARSLDLARQARDAPVRSRGELLAELLMSESAAGDDLLERARRLGIRVGGWHTVVRIEADGLDEAVDDEVRRFELLESAGQAALRAAAASGDTWYLSRIARAIILIRETPFDPGPQAGIRAVRSAERALRAIRGRVPPPGFRAGVGTAHEGPAGLRASAAEARGALAAARTAGAPAGVAALDAVGIRRMLMEWYASDTVRASVRDQLAPLEKLGPGRADTAIRTLATYLDEQGSIIRTAQKLHLHRNAVTNRLRGITELLDADLGDPDQRLALQLACRARLLG